MGILEQLKKAKDLAAEAAESVQNTAQDAVDVVRKKIGEGDSMFLVETFKNPEELSLRLNALLSVMSEVNVRGLTTQNDDLVVIIRVVKKVDQL